MNIKHSISRMQSVAFKKFVAVSLAVLMFSVMTGALAHDPAPACINIGGNLLLSPSGSLFSDIGGLTPCTEYDQLSVSGTLNLNNATLEVVLFNGFVPAYGDRFDIMDWDSLTGTFGVIDTSGAALPAPLVWDTSQLYVSGELVVDVQPIANGDLAPWDDPDGQINAADVMIAAQLVLGQRIPGEKQFAYGDMNNDGMINLADLILISKAAF